MGNWQILSLRHQNGQTWPCMQSLNFSDSYLKALKGAQEFYYLHKLFLVHSLKESSLILL